MKSYMQDCFNATLTFLFKEFSTLNKSISWSSTSLL